MAHQTTGVGNSEASHRLLMQTLDNPEFDGYLYLIMRVFLRRLFTVGCLWGLTLASCAYSHNPFSVAKKAAAYELNCDEVIHAEEIGDSTIVGPNEMYQIGVRGCGKSDTYMIACQARGSSCAFMDRSERLKTKNQ